VLIPLFGAALVAATRVVDYKHNVDDTIWGALIGKKKRRGRAKGRTRERKIARNRGKEREGGRE
jgi:hypothetical protein